MLKYLELTLDYIFFKSLGRKIDSYSCRSSQIVLDLAGIWVA